MLHIASSDQKQMAALTGSPPRVNSQKLKFAQAEAPLRFSSFKTCHFFSHAGTVGPLTSPHCQNEKLRENISSCRSYYRLLEKMGENFEVLAHQLFVYRPHSGQ